MAAALAGPSTVLYSSTFMKVRLKEKIFIPEYGVLVKFTEMVCTACGSSKNLIDFPGVAYSTY